MSIPVTPEMVQAAEDVLRESGYVEGTGSGLSEVVRVMLVEALADELPPLREEVTATAGEMVVPIMPRWAP